MINDIKRLKQVAYLLRNPLCVKCKTQPHMKGNPYCRTCVRIANDLPIVRLRPNVDRNNKLCCRCKLNPRRKGGDYCVQCANAMFRVWWKEEGKEKRRLLTG